MKKIMLNVKYSFTNWKIKPFESLFLLLQIVASLIIICYLLTNYYRYGDVLEKINFYMGEKNIYTFSDLGTDWCGDSSSENLLQKYKTVLSSVEKSDVTTVLASTEILFTDRNNNELNSIQINDKFFEVYNIKIEKSLETIEKVFAIKEGDINKQKVVSVYLGSDYKEMYALGDIMKCFGVDFKVVGFLDKDQTIVLPMQEKENISTNDMVLIPYYIDENDIECMQIYVEGLQFIVENKNAIAPIIKTINELRIKDYYLKNYQAQLKVVKSDYKELFTLFGGMGIIISLFSVVSILGMIISIVEDREYEFGVSLMCGATKNDIFVRLVLHEVFIFVVGVAIVYCIYGFTRASNCVLIISMICIMLICIFSYKKINVKKINDSIKSKD